MEATDPAVLIRLCVFSLSLIFPGDFILEYLPDSWSHPFVWFNSKAQHSITVCTLFCLSDATVLICYHDVPFLAVFIYLFFLL